MNTLLIFGLGYCGRAVAEAAADFDVVATSRAVGPPVLHAGIGHDLASSLGSTRGSSSARAAPAGSEISSTARESDDQVGPARDDAAEILPRPKTSATMVPFDAADAAIARATHILVTVPPVDGGDPVLNRYADQMAAAPGLRWIGYLSSTVVYGDRGGEWVDEDTPPAPSQPRGERRVAAERAWSRFSDRCAVDIFRLAGIYGPGRSAFDDLRAGTARRVIKPGHQFGRIHRDDIARAVAVAMRQPAAPRVRVLNLADDVPSESAAVVTEAARLMGIAPPREVAFAEAALSPMARGFWAENRKVSSRKTQESLGLRWLYPCFRDGLAAIWRQESGDGSP